MTSYISVPGKLIIPSYGQKELFDVVSDVALYPQFIPFCTAARIVKPPERLHEKTLGQSSSMAEKPGHVDLPPSYSMNAELTVGFMNFTESYVSKVTCVPHTSVQVNFASLLHWKSSVVPRALKQWIP